MGFREEIAVAAAFESRSDDEREMAWALDQGDGLRVVLKPGIGLLTELAWEAGDDFDAWH